MEGWISLHRQIVKHWTFEEKRTFSKFEAWIDLILMANHKTTRFPLGNEIIEAKRGEVITSEIKLMERWKWGKSKTRSFLEVLESDGMIVKKTDRKKTSITICNYCVFQDLQTTNRPQADREQTASRPRADTINNVNNDNHDNKKKKELIYTSEFNQFWSIYPRKIGKAEAFKTWKALIKKGEASEYIIQCADNYAKDCKAKGTEEQFVKHPKTFLNEERYKDYFMIVIGGGNNVKPQGNNEKVRHGRDQAQGNGLQVSDEDYESLIFGSPKIQLQ